MNSIEAPQGNLALEPAPPQSGHEFSAADQMYFNTHYQVYREGQERLTDDQRARMDSDPEYKAHFDDVVTQETRRRLGIATDGQPAIEGAAAGNEQPAIEGGKNGHGKEVAKKGQEVDVKDDDWVLGELVDDEANAPRSQKAIEDVDGDVLAIGGKKQKGKGTVYQGGKHPWGEGKDSSPATQPPAKAETTPPSPELPQDVLKLAHDIAKLKKTLEGRIFKRGDAKLEDLANELKHKMDNLAAPGSPERTQLSQQVNEEITAERIRLADAKIRGATARIGNSINNITGKIANWVKNHKKAALIGLTVVGLGVATGLGIGLAAGAGAAMLVAGAKGLVAGAITGSARGYLTARGRLAQANLTGAVADRYMAAPGQQIENEGTWASHTHEFRQDQRAKMGKNIGKSALVGGVAGGLVAAAGAGYVVGAPRLFAGGAESHGGAVTGDVAHAPGNEQVHINETDLSVKAKDYPGRYAWDSYRHGLENHGTVMSEGKTLTGVIDGARFTQDASLQVPGLKFGTWGKINPDTLVPTGNKWGFNIEVTNPNLKVVNGNDVINLTPGKLNGPQQAALFDALNNGGKIVDAGQVAATSTNKVAQAVIAGGKAASGNTVVDALNQGAIGGAQLGAEQLVGPNGLPTAVAVGLGGITGAAIPSERIGRESQNDQNKPEQDAGVTQDQPRQPAEQLGDAATRTEIRNIFLAPNMAQMNTQQWTQRVDEVARLYNLSRNQVIDILREDQTEDNK